MAEKTGLLVRSYAGKSITEYKDFDEVIQRAVKTARAALALNVGGKPAFHKVLFVVPFDHDVWGTAPRLSEVFKEQGINVTVMTAPGHHSREVLNHGIMRLTTLGCDRVCIFSNKALSYLTPETMRRIDDEFALGSLAVGVRLHDLNDVQVSAVQNTFCVWDIEELRTVGLFDSDTGVEEVAPLIRLAKKYGRCISVVQGEADAAFVTRKSADGKARHTEVRDTKRARQEAEAARLGVTLEWLKDHIMEESPIVA